LDLVAAFFLRSAHLFFISSDSLFRPAALNLLARFRLAALLLDAVLVCRVAYVTELDPVRILRAEVSFAISASISCTILLVSIESSPPHGNIKSMAGIILARGDHNEPARPRLAIAI
jgi:hypothetical protein